MGSETEGEGLPEEVPQEVEVEEEEEQPLAKKLLNATNVTSWDIFNMNAQSGTKKQILQNLKKKMYS